MEEAEVEDEGSEEEEEPQLDATSSMNYIVEEEESFNFNQGSRIWTFEASSVFPVVDLGVEGVVTQQHLKDISHELGLVKLCWTDVPEVQFDERQHYPLSYLQNNKKEKLLLWYAENFRQQFQFKYKSRRPLLIACDNECGVQKMVSTTIRPTNMKFPEFDSWQGCANFVAEYLTYEKLSSPTILPDHLFSPQTVLKRQSGHCFEYSTLLVSILIGSGYNAFVVNGYATREICYKDQSRVDCPFLEDEPEIEEEEEIIEDIKYFLRKPVELKSQFLADMEAREIQREIDARRAQELAELEAIKEFEKPPPDELWGWRLHSWVVILPSKEITEPFFIEPTTGIAKPITDPEYHGIESVWNHQNYWIFVQFYLKTETCSDISFNLNDQTCWERLLMGEPIYFREMPQDLVEGDPDELAQACIEAEKHLDMPCSWVDILDLSYSAYERRYPNAKKVTYYRKAICEQYAPYSQSDGLLEKVKRFDDYECRSLREIRERYANRYDRMYFCQKTPLDNSVLEKFHRGREDGLKERFYYSMDSGIEAKFSLLFYPQARLDGLSKWIMDPLFMTMHFEDRIDFLYYVHIEFAERTGDNPFRTIEKITEKYHRNREKDADKDIAMVEFSYTGKKLLIKFHYENDHVTHTNRIFMKPSCAEKEVRFSFDPSLTWGYLTGPDKPQPKPLYLYQLEVEYFKQEDLAVKRTREREDELLCLLRLRAQELAAPRLMVSEFDSERNISAKEAFQEREREKEELLERDMKLECDFLAPYFAKRGLKLKTDLPLQTAQDMIDECLKDWKNLLVTRANEIQRQFEQACQEFQEKSKWYEANQNTITKEQEEEYFEYCKKNSYHLHILEVRLNRHKEISPQRFYAVQYYLRHDPRLAVVYQTKRKRHR